MQSVYVLRTPENVTFELELAGVGARGIAFAIDAMIIGVFAISVSSVLSALDVVAQGFAKALLPVVFFVTQWGYGVVLEWKADGTTIGKRLLKLRVLGLDGFKVTLAQAAIRNLVKIVDMLPAAYGVGAVCIAFHPRAQRLGDMAAGTVVVRERRGAVPESFVVGADLGGAFLTDPLVAHAVRRITAPERDAMIALAVRRETLPLSVRHALFGLLAAHLSSRTSIEKPTYFSDERYVLNLATAFSTATKKGISS